MTYEMTFETSGDLTNYLSALSFRALPVRGVFAAPGYTDDGARIITFARRHLSNPMAFTFTEMPRRT